MENKIGKIINVLIKLRKLTNNLQTLDKNQDIWSYSNLKGPYFVNFVDVRMLS